MDACLLIVELMGQMDPPLPHPPSISISALCTNIHNGNALIKNGREKTTMRKLAVQSGMEIRHMR